MSKKKRTLRSGEVVLLDFPGVNEIKRRPAVVVSSDLYHKQRPDVIVGILTSQIDAARAATDYVLQDWAQARLHCLSAFKTFLVTVPRTAITARVGKLSPRDWRSVQRRLGLALSLNPL